MKKINIKILTVFFLLVGISVVIPSAVFAASNDNDDSNERPNAYPEWDADVYSSTSTALARVVDSYMNQDPNKVETLIVDIYVKRNIDEGISITLTETSTNTGIFEGTVIFTETEESSGNRLKVAEGDKAYVDYAYFEIIDSDNIEDMIVIGDKAEISNSQTDKQQQDIADTTITDESNLAFVKLDKKIYTWTDKINISISAPSLNLDDNLVEEIGNTTKSSKNINKEFCY